MVYIESFSNARYKWLKGLSKSKNRRKEGLFLMEGRVELELALRRGHQPTLVAFTSSYITRAQLLQFGFDPNHVELVELSKALFDGLAYQQVPGNFIAVFQTFKHVLTKEAGMLAILESVEKPGNLGAVLRTCDALGIHNLIVTESEIDLFNPNAIRNSRGAIFTVNCCFQSNEEARAHIRSGMKWLLAAALTEDAVDFNSVQRKDNIALVLGAESKGLTEFWLDEADQTVVIPMRGEVDSLNLSVSFAILASHFK
ncbi:MAG: TrmH family RNA methyltransferase [Cryomorphaceae bacterium]